ncbi:SDR family NAD(P)-dependent oxidoreductase [Nocardioides donggukensis]|uniref:SDR family NAD(P)-dependent oxidoreductase n=1 Tax=Nocardioides donggukensis TaxID=2774019 RepID=A0A927K7E8_9ACTN|nr:SDR family NAD(P)-dependent oxidoreductase [Nocardioides donggukensis]MBD8870545.1 SDR family NAD(P)-dependent oxidoreductase [Nocardioides donggukensis]
MRTLRDKVVVVTGAGSGIGRAVAVEVAGRGAAVAISDVDEAGLAETVDLVKAAGAHEVRSDRLDVADRPAFASYAAAVREHFGRVNVIVNNAGVTMTGDFEELTYEQFEWIMSINFWGVVTGTKEFLPHLIESGDGHVVNISSLFGLVSMPGQSSYNASKYAVRGFTEALREEMLVAGHPVGVTCVHPGGIRTGISRNGRKTASQDGAAVDALFERRLARMEPSRAAEIIVRGFTADRARVLVGIDAHLIHHAAKLAGSRYQDVVARLSKRLLPPAR